MLPYILIHGAGGTRRRWDRVVPHLRRRALAVDLPGRGDKPGDLDSLTVNDFARSVVDDMDAAGIDRAIVGGASLAGLTMVTLAELIPERIARLVFINCVVPPDGKGNFHVVGERVREMVDRYGVGEDGQSLHPDAIRAYHCNDMDEEQIQFAIDGMVKDARKPLHRPISLAGIKAHPLPCTWVLGTLDQVILPDVQLQCVATLRECGCPVDVVDFEAGHMAAISRPKQLAAVLDSLDE
ncbi:MAG: alpha/beta hydrolase [Gammaproteobacteria bacterium]|nr:alpha/beta hydrolase [Gammaproteobacteria bacterium]MDE0366777.1 alpha/beta hydrolase [Gammaproteobacteria bacterium]